jgi:ElaB/YqjD/DUF883 family membrane-anchored ribosome-binding protein
MKTQERTHPEMLDRIATRTAQHVRETAGEAVETAARAGEGLAESLDTIEMKFNDIRDSVVERTKEYSRATNTYVRRNPWVVIGISAGIAFLAGMVVGRRRGD